MRHNWPSISKRTTLSVLFIVMLSLGASVALAHPLGNFTINHFARIEVTNDAVKLYTVIDMAEIPTFQELQKIDVDGDSKASSTELNEYLNRVSGPLADQMWLSLNGQRFPLSVIAKRISLPTGAGGLETLRIELDLSGQLATDGAREVRELKFEDRSFAGRIGWREIVAAPGPGIAIFNSTAFANTLSDELKAYPAEMLTAPLDERSAQFSFSVGSLPAGARPLMSRGGVDAPAPARDRLADLIAAPTLTPGLVLFGLLFAVVLGAAHALSPGHGKTVVGAYLVGSRGTARHAAFLGLTVTITHTAGVFALGLVTLLASEYVVPEKLFPFLSLLSGGIVVTIGLSLFLRRLRNAIGIDRHRHEGHGHDHEHHHHADDHHHQGMDPNRPHSHGGPVHSHLPPGADGSPITWKSLLALGVSGGLLPCPSALVILLAAISLHRVGYGLLLVVAFSAGLAAVLTAVGLMFVYAGRLLKTNGTLNRLSRVLPIGSALVITCAGLAICYQALGQAGIDLLSLGNAFIAHVTPAAAAPALPSLGAVGVLGIGLVYGLKHATEVDHIVAVSTIVSEHKHLGRAALVGGLWGAGHTASLVIVGAIVLGLRIAIPQNVAGWLEFGVALMIIALGLAAFRRALRGRFDVHVHRHDHNAQAHAHIHFHEHGGVDAHRSSQPHSHSVARIGLKPTLVGAMHGLAGSGALTLLVLTQIDSAGLGLLYLGVFGIGSIIGMLLMSSLVGLPFVLSSRKLGGIHYSLQMIAGVLSIAFGVWYAYETGLATGLIKSLAMV